MRESLQKGAHTVFYSIIFLEFKKESIARRIYIVKCVKMQKNF
jgi:hypothetical protein